MSALDAAVRGLAETLVTGTPPGKPESPYVPRFLVGTVAALSPPSVSVTFPASPGGAVTTVTDVPTLATGRALVVGDVVLVLQQPHQRLVLGALGPGSGGAFTTSGAGGGAGGLTTVALAGVSLGSVGGSYVWNTLTVGAKADVWRFALTATAATDWDILVTSGAGGTGETMFHAEHITVATYSCSWVWRYANGDTPVNSHLYLGVRSHAGTVPVTLDDLRADTWS